MTRILVGTAEGLHDLNEDGRLRAVHHAARSVVAIAGSDSQRWAVLDGAELQHRR